MDRHNDETFLDSMIGNSDTSDVDLEGALLSIFEHDSIQDTQFDKFEASGPSKKKAIRGSKFKPNEDVAVVLAWQDISLDAIARKDQWAAKYWNCVKEHFQHHLGRKPNRSLKSLTTRWGKIQEMCSRWSGFKE